MFGAVSQTHSHNSGNFPAFHAVDDDPDTFSHTRSGETGAALVLTFPGERLITRVEVLTRGDCCGGRLDGSRLKVFNEADELVYEVAVEDDGPGTVFSASLPDGIGVKTVRVGFEDDQSGIVHIAELRLLEQMGVMPVIESFTVSGGQLSWNVTGADEIRIEGIGDVAAIGTLNVAPSESTVYVLVAKNECFQAAASVVVEVGGIPLTPRISEFSAYPDDWVEIWHPGNESVDLSGWSLTDDPGDPRQWVFPNGTNLSAGEFLVVDDPFGIAREAGGYLALIAADGTIVSEYVDYPHQDPRGTYGRDFGGVERFFLTPTQGELNFSETTLGFLRGVTFSVERGFYESPIMVSLDPKTPGASVMYSLDGSEPSIPYTMPLTLSQTRSVRAKELKAGFEPSFSEAQTYLFLSQVGQQSQFPAGFPTDWQPPGTTGALEDIPRPTDYGMDPDVIASAPWTNLQGESFGLEEALRDLPTMVLTLPNEMMWGFDEGLHANSALRGREWEREISMEILDPINGEHEHVNCGLRIHGGRSRVAEMLRKSFRLYFRGDYNRTKFEYPLFENMPSGGVDHLVLRGGTGRTWASPWRPLTDDGNALDRVTYLRDQFYRDSQQTMGNPSFAGGFVHLFINGLYWGIYNPVERPGGDWCANHFGGDEEDYDVIKWANLLPPQNVSGTTQAWEELIALSRGNVEANWSQILERLDVENLIDYMLLNFYTGNDDWIGNNSYAYRSSKLEKRFRFLCWDGEEYFKSISRNSTTDGRDKTDTPLELHDNLRAGSAEYRLLFADHIHRHLRDEDGVLTPGLARARHDLLVAELDQAIVGESARWGDLLRPNEPYLRSPHWLGAVDVVNDPFIVQRSGNSFQHMKDDDLFPDVEPPTVTMAGDAALLVSAATEVWFTTDGSDPRAVDGGVSSSAMRYDNGLTTNFVPFNSSWRFLDDGSDLTGSAWRDLAFNDTSWSEGPAPLGYGGINGLTLATTISSGPDPSRRAITTWFRQVFDVASTESLVNLELRIIRDDGAVVHLNGTEVARFNMSSGAITASTEAATTVGGSAESEIFFQTIPISALVEGENVLAVELHQTSDQSSDVVFDLELVGTEGVLPLPGDARIRTRAREAGQWSALEDEIIRLVEPRETLVISEVMYHPVDPTPVEEASGFLDDDLFEFIELRNVSDRTIVLDGMRFTKGVNVTLSGSLAAGEYGLVVAHREAFESRYGGGMQILAEWPEDNRLDNGGERIRLRDAADQIVIDFIYDDRAPWPTAADGGGRSLVLRNAKALPSAVSSSNWRVSTVAGGNAGTNDGVIFPGGTASDLLAFALRGEPRISSDEIIFPLNILADNLEAEIQQSSDLQTWSAVSEIEAGAVLRNETGDSAELVVPLPQNQRVIFYRYQVTAK